MNIDSTESYKELLITVLHNHSQEHVKLIFVDDIKEWCDIHRVECRGNPIAMAIMKASTILLLRAIDEYRIRSIIDRQKYVGGFVKELENIVTPEKFLTHTVLHELAHLVNNWGQDKEDECDEWAFKKMGVSSKKHLI